MTWTCPQCATPMQPAKAAKGGHWIGPFVRRDWGCPGCGHQQVTREYEVSHIQEVEKRVIDLEKAVARYQDELWEQGKL